MRLTQEKINPPVGQYFPARCSCSKNGNNCYYDFSCYHAYLVSILSISNRKWHFLSSSCISINKFKCFFLNSVFNHNLISWKLFISQNTLTLWSYQGESNAIRNFKKGDFLSLVNLFTYLLKLLEKCATFKKENAPKFKLSNGNLEAICEFWKPSLQTHSKLR